MDLLLFRLYGPMASWGEIAVGERRHTASYPSKSALLGLLGAALGIRRDDEERQHQLQQSYAIAVELITAGNLLRDYHTAQAPDSAGRLNYRTRRDEIVFGKERLGTILSSREYRSDGLTLVAVRALNNAPFGLAEIKDKLLKPVFHLYLGRKSCPLAAPLNPQLFTGQANFLAAFKSYCHKPLLRMTKSKEGNPAERDCYWLGINQERHYYWEGSPEDFSDTLDLTRPQTRIRRDQPLSRKRWQFVPRQEHYLFQGEE